MRKKISSWALILTTSMLTILLISMFGIALANASDENADEGIMSNGESLFGFLAPQANPVLGGIFIYDSEGNPATENSDFTVDNENKILYLLSNELTLTGGSDKGPINARIVVANDSNNIYKLTLDELHIYDKTQNHSTLEINCPTSTEADFNANSDFTLGIKNACTLYQTLDEGELHGGRAIEITGGSTKGFTIEGLRAEDEKSKLECVAYFLDAIFVNADESVTFTGTFDALVYSLKDDGIDWSKLGDSRSLTIEDHAYVAFGSENIHVYNAIDVGSLNVYGFASLLALGNNKDTKECPAVNVKNNFNVNTNGDVLIDAWNDKSWQAIDCNNITISKCRSFTAIAQDYPALICRGKMIIEENAIENVYLSGGFIPREESDHRARRGAFVIEHPDRLIVPKFPDGSERYLLFGSEDKKAEVENINRRSVLTFSSGSDAYDVYTPVVLNGNNLPKYADTVIFKQAQEVIFVPGQKATYSESGYNPCYKYKDIDVLNDSVGYFEDYDQQMPIEDYEAWKSPGGDGYIPSFRGSFDDYRQSVLDKCDELYVFGDNHEIDELIQYAKSEIESYIYDEERTISQNKSNLDSIYGRLKWDIDMLPMPVPEPANWEPSSDVEVVESNITNIDSKSNGQTGDKLALIIIALVTLIALSSAFVILKKKNIVKLANFDTNNFEKTISKNKVLLISVVVLIPILLFTGLAVANANENDEGYAPVTFQDNSLLSKFLTPNFTEAYPGLYITKINSEGQEVDAVPNVDFIADEEFKTLQISTDGLIITGKNSGEYVEVSIVTTVEIENVKNLTLKNAWLYSKYSSQTSYGNTLVLNCNQYQPEPEPEQYSVIGSSKDFNLNIVGTCYIGQENEENGGRPIYVEGGGDHGANIHGKSEPGEPESTLYVYSTWYEGIMSQQAPLLFSGHLNIFILSEYDNCIAWETEHLTDMMFITDDVNMACLSPSEHNYEAIVGGSLFVTNHASLFVVNNNETARDAATINLRHTFGISTTGIVKIGNANKKSWQAIRCEDLSIMECREFVAISRDYAAIECSGTMSIQTPNVWIYGEYDREQTGNVARKGAFTIKDLNKLSIAPNLHMLGSQNPPDDATLEDWGDINNVATMVQTSGEDVDEMYSPVACDGNFATIAKVITFADTSHNTQLVPGEDASFALPGYKDCYKCIDCGSYFVDEQCETKIGDLDFWRSPFGDGFLAPYCFEFKIYQAEIRCQCEENMIKRADVPEIRAMIAAAQAKIDAYVYDEGMSLATNKAAIDKIYYELYDEVMNYSPYNSSEVIVETAQTGDNLMIYIFVLITFIAIAGTGILVSRNY